MAAALDLPAIAAMLISCGLVAVRERIVLDPRLAQVGEVASEDVLKRIAKLLLGKHELPWLRGAVLNGRFASEFVPTAVLDGLAWLESDIEPIIIDVHAFRRSEDDGFREWLGSIGESLVVASETQIGSQVRQVSLISDHFGYDIESRNSTSLRFIEVKTSILGASSSRVFLSRNEADVARSHVEHWSLVHVVLKASALTGERIDLDDISHVNHISAARIIQSLPIDTPASRWINAVEIRTEALEWLPYTFSKVPHTWCVGPRHLSRPEE